MILFFLGQAFPAVLVTQSRTLAHMFLVCVKSPMVINKDVTEEQLYHVGVSKVYLSIYRLSYLSDSCATGQVDLS